MWALNRLCGASVTIDPPRCNHLAAALSPDAGSPQTWLGERTEMKDRRREHSDRVAKPLRVGARVFLAHTQPGFEPVAWSEVAAKIEGAREIGGRVVPGRNG